MTRSRRAFLSAVAGVTATAGCLTGSRDVVTVGRVERVRVGDGEVRPLSALPEAVASAVDTALGRAAVTGRWRLDAADDTAVADALALDYVHTDDSTRTPAGVYATLADDAGAESDDGELVATARYPTDAEDPAPPTYAVGDLPDGLREGIRDAVDAADEGEEGRERVGDGREFADTEYDGAYVTDGDVYRTHVETVA